MRLWHESLIPLLPRQQLLGQHRECAALRGLGWGKKHSTVDYVFNYSPARLVAYHHLIIKEMLNRGYCPNTMWQDFYYRGRSSGVWEFWDHADMNDNISHPIFPEHNSDYLQKCVDNLARKGIQLNICFLV